jgi:DNA helicase-2/ATP-dependent DNA helicase PcrA
VTRAPTLTETTPVPDVHLYEDGGRWVVAAGDAEHRFDTRSSAFAKANELARSQSPSRVVREPPPTALAPERVEPVAVRNVGEPRPWDRLAGHPELGRSVLVAPGSDAPGPWADCPRVVVDIAGLTSPDLLAQVRSAFLSRTPTVYEVAPEVEVAPAVTSAALVDVDVYAVSTGFEFGPESLWRLMTANAVDARDAAAPFWPWTGRAVAAGATATGGADVVLPDGREAVCDGGPFRAWPAGSIGSIGSIGSAATVVVPRLSIERGVLLPVHHDQPTAELAPDQLAAVCEPGGKARIIAPAGSGKTRVLTERVRHLHRVGVPLDAMCLVAFNKRAQEEMASRTADLPGLQIQTLNALALAILNGRNGFRPRNVRVSTINELDVRRHISELVAMPRRANTDPVAAWIDALSAVRLGLTRPADVETEFGGDVDGFAEFFPRYRDALHRRDLVDFDEQIYLAIEVLLTEPATRRQAQHMTRLLMVDEFQDLTPAHLSMIRLLAGPELDVFGVGDDDQTIYGYSGASPEWLIDFADHFAGAESHALVVNYRCPTRVVTAAGNLLSRNQRRVAKQIVAGPGNRTDPGALEVVVVDEPVVETAARIERLIAAGSRPDEIVVLARVNTLLAPVQVALHQAGIPVVNRDGVRFLERTGVRAALSWLRIADQPTNLAAADIQQAARRPSRSLSPKVIEWMGEQSDLAGVRRLAGRLKGKDADKVMAFASDAEQLVARAGEGTTAQLLEFVRSEMGLDQTMTTLDASHRGRNSAAHTDDLRALVALGRLHPEITGFAGWLARALNQPDDPDGVVLSTVHKVKGLEWPNVVIHDASQGLFPHRLSTDVEEERRVFHVALTRGQTSVTVVAEAGSPSMFLAELDDVAPPRSAPPAAAVAASARKGPDEVAAAVDLELEWGGYEGVVSAVGPDGVTLQVGRATFAIAFGSKVKVAGRLRMLGPSAKASRSSKSSKGGASGQPSENPELFEALRVWRSGRAKADGMPAYVVAKDTTLEAIAQMAPVSLADLLTIDGIGPAKLERYGDEILAVVDELTPPG